MKTGYLSLIFMAVGCGQSWIATDFAAPYVPVTNNARATGALPARWQDNSNWASVWVSYQRMSEDGRTFLRIETTRADDGWTQLYHPLPRSEGEAYYRLTAEVRSLDGQSITLGVRRNGAPYNFLWQTAQPFPAEWRTVRYLFRMDRADYDIGLYIPISGLGRVDFGAFRLERYTREQLTEVLRQEAQAAGVTNLSRISRFPLGMQTGMVLDRESSDDLNIVESDPGMPGPSGSPSLRVASAQGAQLYLAPFAVLAPAELHTASISVRGRGGVTLAAIADSRVVARQVIAPTGDTWKRAVLTWRPDLLGRYHAIRLDVTGEAWFDGFQVELGPTATPYASQLPSEVALAVESPARVIFDDEPQVLSWTVTGPAAAGKLRLRGENLYGETLDLPAIELAANSLQHGNAELPVPDAHPYGTFRWEAWVEDAAGTRVSPYSEIVIQRLRRPRYWLRDAPGSPFGTHTNSTVRHILMAKAIGINWTRLHDAGTQYTGWYHLERRPGVWTFRDDDLYRYRRYGLKILGAFATAPEWASYFDVARNGYYDRYYQPKSLAPFANYVGLLAEGYRDIIDTYDLWNEPWIPGYWAVGWNASQQAYVTSANPQADFVKLAQSAYETAKSRVPSLRIAGVNSTTGGPSGDRKGGTEWTQGVVDAGGLNFADILCYHQYTSAELGYPGDDVARGFRAAMGPALQAVGEAKPVWMTEGSPTAGQMGAGFFRHTTPVEEFDAPWTSADRTVRYVVSLLAQGVEKVFLYSMHTHVYFGGGNEYRALVGVDGYLHPSGAAHSTMAWLLEDTRFADSASPAEGVTAYRFDGPRGMVTVLIPRSRHAPYALPQPGLDLFGNPVPKGSELGKTVVFLAGE